MNANNGLGPKATGKAAPGAVAETTGRPGGGIGKVAVLGAGTMGALIAAHVANAGVPVLLLDMTREAAEKGKALLGSRRPDPLMHPSVAELIETGDFDQDLQRIADCDWIIEAIIEKVEPKRQMFARVEALRKPGSVVSSNSSGILLREMSAGLPDSFRQDFLIVHFFNPPRYMGLVEIVAGEQTSDKARQRVWDFCYRGLGKQVVAAQDTPGFIANRIGVVALAAGVRLAIDEGLTVEEVDAVAGRPMGFPRTAILGLIDLIGFDVVELVCNNFKEQLGEDDPAREFIDLPDAAKKMLERGMLGRKAGGGFYRVSGAGSAKKTEVVDLETLVYRGQQPVALKLPKPGQLRELAAQQGPVGRFAWQFLSTLITYAAQVAAEVTDSVASVDMAMREGFSWRWGPFEMAQLLGIDYLVDRLEREGRAVPALLQLGRDQGAFYREGQGGQEYLDFEGQWQPLPRQSEAWQVADLRRDQQPLLGNEAASIWDAGDGVAVLEFHSKMNAINPQTVEILAAAPAIVDQGFAALIIGNDAANISVGADLQLMLEAAERKDWDFLRRFIADLQNALLALKLAPFPVVAAARGMALGGGCEVVLHCNAVQAHAEFKGGLVEPRVGLIPAGGGSKEMTLRYAGYVPAEDRSEALQQAFGQVMSSRVSASAAYARQMRLLTNGDGVTMHQDLLLNDTKQRALQLVPGYLPPAPASLALPGASGVAPLLEWVDEAIEKGALSAHDRVVGEALARVMTGGDCTADTEVTEQQLLALESECFLDLLARPESRARMAHMLKTGKPLRN